MRTLSIAAFGLVFGIFASSAQASPWMCAKAIYKTVKNAKSIKNVEFKNFQDSCAEHIECKKGCRSDKKAFNKTRKSVYKFCKSECKKHFKETKKGNRKNAKAEKKSCMSLCDGVNKAAKDAFSASGGKKCKKTCKPKVSAACKSAQKDLTKKLIATGVTDALKIASACTIAP